jgi:putative phosphoribosyl transferase
MPIRERRGDPPEAGHDRVDADRRPVVVEVDAVRLPGDLAVPAGSVGIVIFAHGSGSSRRSPRNMQVAERLNDAGLGTLLFDLLTPEEAGDRANVFDIALLAERLSGAEAWVSEHAATGPVGLFGASTGAAAALVAAAGPGSRVGAVVSRGGRPDLADAALPIVTAPTLLIVGGADRQVLELNREAAARMRCEHRLEVIPGATHLFEEPGALEQVAELAADWFRTHLTGSAGRRAPISAPDE